MSRCFPFPPPGFESRPRSEERHKDLLRKEKHKDKKHRKGKDREKGETKEKGRDHRKDKHNRKHKRAKCRERKKNGDIYKDRNQTLRHRKPEENGQHESVKDIIPADELVTRIFGQGDHTDHNYNNTELLPWSTDSIGCTGSKEKERNLLGRMVKKSSQATEYNYGMVQKSDSIAHANKIGMGRGVDSKTEMKNGKSLQDRSAEMHSRRRHNCKGVGVCYEWISGSSNLTCVDEKMSRHPQWITGHSSTELIGLNTCDIGQHECQHSYNNGITGSRYLEEQMPSVSSSGYESNTGYLEQPHPDTKYLSQVHCIPSTQDFSEFIDQDWLFSMDHVRQKTVTLEAVESRQVWSDAQLIDTADVIAMPYVVPL